MQRTVRPNKKTKKRQSLTSPCEEMVDCESNRWRSDFSALRPHDGKEGSHRPSVTQRAFSAMTRCDTVVNGEPSVRTGFLSPAPRRSQPRPLSRYTAGRSRLARVGDLFELLPS